jgi:hypothetical protein
MVLYLQGKLVMWTITLWGRDPLPVLSSWSTRERAVKAATYWLKRGYSLSVHKIGESLS